MASENLASFFSNSFAWFENKCDKIVVFSINTERTMYNPMDMAFIKVDLGKWSNI